MTLLALSTAGDTPTGVPTAGTSLSESESDSDSTKAVGVSTEAAIRASSNPTNTTKHTQTTAAVLFASQTTDATSSNGLTQNTSVNVCKFSLQNRV